MQGQSNNVFQPNNLQQQQYFMNQSYSTTQQVYFTQQYGNNGGFIQPNTLPAPLTPQPSNIMAAANNQMNNQMMQPFNNNMIGSGGGSNNMINSGGAGNGMMQNQQRMINSGGGGGGGSNNMINSGGGSINNNMINSGGGGGQNNNMINSGGGGQNNNMINSGGGGNNSNLINSGGKSTDNKNRWFPTNDNDPFHAVEQEKQRPQYKAANWSDANKYAEIVSTLNSPGIMHHGNPGINTLPNMHHQQHMMGPMISTMPNPIGHQHSSNDLLAMQQQQMTPQQQQMMMNQMMMNQQQQQMTPQQQQMMMNQMINQQQQQMTPQQQMMIQQQIMNPQMMAPMQINQQQMIQQQIMNPQQMTPQQMVPMNQMNQMNPMIAAGMMVANQPGTTAVVQIQGQQSSSSSQQITAILSPPQPHTQRTGSQGAHSISPSASISPQKMISPTASLNGPVGGLVPVSSLTGSLPTNKSTPPIINNGGAGSGNLVASVGKEMVIPPIPAHLQSNSFANPNKHGGTSVGVLASILPNPQQSQSQQQQQQPQNNVGGTGAYSGSFMVQQNTTTTSSSTTSLQQQQQTSPNQMYSFEQFIVPMVAEPPKPTFNTDEEIKKNIEKYQAIENLSPPPQTNVTNDSPKDSSMFVTSPSVFSEEDYKKQVEERIRKEVEEKVRREYEEKAAANNKKTEIPPPVSASTTKKPSPPQQQQQNNNGNQQSSIKSPTSLTTTTSNSTNINSITTTTTTSPLTSPPPQQPTVNINLAPPTTSTSNINSSSSFPIDLFADLTTTTTSSSSSTSHHTTTTSSNISPNLSRNPITNVNEKDRLKKELVNIHSKPAATATTNSATLKPKTSAGVQNDLVCPICQSKFASERILAVHIDDWHSSLGPSIRDEVFAKTKTDDYTPKGWSALSFEDTKPKDNTTKPRAKTVSAQPTAVTRDKKSVSFEIDEQLKRKTITTQSSSSSTISSHSFTSQTITKPRSDSTDLSTSFESVFIPPARVLTQEEAVVILQKNVRRWKCRKEYKREILRTKAVRELVFTEHTYVDGLEKLVEQFAFPLKGLFSANCALISQEDIEIIFGKHEIILSYNRELCRKLVERIAKWNVVQRIGDVLVDTVTKDEFKTIYNNFTLSFQQILSTIEKLSNTKSQFKAFLKNAERSLWTNGSATGTNLQSLLITPVQRITRYLLLLKEIIRHTKPSHPDYDMLCVSLFEVQDICLDVNENQRKEEKEKIRIQTLANIANRIDPKPKEFQLIADNRFLIREGRISQYDAEDEKRKERIYYLFNDLILIAKESKKKLQLKNIMYLNNLKIRNIADGQKTYGTVSKNAFELRGHGDQVLMFFTDNQEDKDALLKDLEIVISSFAVASK